MKKLLPPVNAPSIAGIPRTGNDVKNTLDRVTPRCLEIAPEVHTCVTVHATPRSTDATDTISSGRNKDLTALPIFFQKHRQLIALRHNAGLETYTQLLAPTSPSIEDTCHKKDA